MQRLFLGIANQIDRLKPPANPDKLNGMTSTHNSNIRKRDHIGCVYDLPLSKPAACEIASVC
jgi:hypothetical protein